MHFLDEAKIYLKSGDGGNGCVSFRREKFIPFGGPDGGNGGKGQDIIFETTEHLNTLIDFRYKQHFKGRNGEHGKGKNRFGASREALVLKVPVGTCIMDDDGEVLLDMDKANMRVLFLEGGKGGAGNANYKSSINQAPRRFTEGKPGDEKWVWLKLKLISDVGLVGLPNAGKSTFLARTTAAKPKIAAYPFTTLIPQLGVVYVKENEFVMADIPGLIEGAHMGVGLGVRFLKHIERCKTILHLIDGTNEDVVAAYKTIRGELEEYSEVLAEKEEMVAINKIDAMTPEEIKDKVKKLKKYVKNIRLVSAVTGEGVEELLVEILNKVKFEEEQEEA